MTSATSVRCATGFAFDKSVVTGCEFCRSQVRPGPTFRMLRGQFGVNFWLLGYPKGVLWDTQQLENEVLQVGELDVEDLHGLAVLQELVPLGKAEQTQDLFRGGTRAVALLGV